METAESPVRRAAETLWRTAVSLMMVGAGFILMMMLSAGGTHGLVALLTGGVVGLLGIRRAELRPLALALGGGAALGVAFLVVWVVLIEPST